MAQTQTKKSSPRQSSRNSGSSVSASRLSDRGDTTAGGMGKSAGTAVLAGSAAAAGLAATLVVAQRARRPRRVLGVPLPKRSGFDLRAIMPRQNSFRGDAERIAGNVTEAADRADRFGQQVSSVATGVKRVSEAAGEAAKRA